MAKPLSYELRCNCGQVRGKVLPTPKIRLNHCVCYCDDCQRYLQTLGRPELLDQNGGTRILQLPPSQIEITAGLDQVRCLRLSPKGLYRFYTACCRTPLANAGKFGMPIGGVLGAMIQGLKEDSPELPVRMRVFGKFAKGTPPAGTRAKFTAWDIGRILVFVASSWATGGHKKTPLFDPVTRRAIVTPEIGKPTS